MTYDEFVWGFVLSITVFAIGMFIYANYTGDDR